MPSPILKLLLLTLIAAGGHVRAEQLSTTRPQAVSPVEVLLSEAPLAEESKPAGSEILAAHSAMVAAFDHAVGEYLIHRKANHWRVRVGIDRRLLRAAGKLPVEYLAGRLDGAPGNMEVSTAVAVCLGEGSKMDSPEFVAGLFSKLLRSDVERVRYRAAEAIVQRVQDHTIPAGIDEPLAAAVAAALAVETNEDNAGSMRFALEVLKSDATNSPAK